MKPFSDKQPEFIREKLIGLGEKSIRKNYYPELQKRLEELETFRNLLDKVNDGILMVRLPSSAIVDANESACAILGFSRNKLLNATLTDLFPTVGVVLQRLVHTQEHRGRRQEFSTEFRRMDGSQIPIEGSIDVVALGENVFAVAILRDVSDRKRADAMLHHVSTHDSLTGLYNRAYLEYEFQRRRDSMALPCALIACDIDGLQMTNETLGHLAGDQRLIMTAVLLCALVETGDILARVGGDEFALIRPGADHNQAEKICRHLRELVESYNLNNKDTFLSLSVGYAIADAKPIELNKLTRDADNQVRREKLLRSQSTRSGIVNTVMTLLEARDFITEGHAERLEVLVGGLAEKIGFAPSQLDAMKLFAKFHDIGKVGISDTILFKPGSLNEMEREEMRRHSEIGYRIALSSVDLLHIAEWILRHHEWWDGSGYPLGLAGETIPLECRILSIVDAFDAMTSDRPYRKAMSVEAAVRELQKFAGIQFDPELLGPFCELLQNQGLLSE
ncbi:MAG TPA: HD domain-containing phosphohydrolase [Negativicutes bacterium]|nr:HD domain-containing phosphohydrolase [Negativicutes bacterium]